VSKRTLLIDGDTLIYEAAAAHEYEAQWEEWLWTVHGDLTASIKHLDDTVAEIKDGLKADDMIVALSDDTRWRPDVMPEYKGNRRKTRKPVTYKAMREYCREVYTVFQRPTLEGDDVLGILATHPKLVEGEKIVVSIDKDMLTIPGLHFNYAHARGSENYESFIRPVTENQADGFHLFQTLTGDTADGYKGCPGVGPVKAEKLLEGQRFSEAWPIVVAAYAKAGLGEEIALQNARVARICRYTDYDFKKKEVVLWNPNSFLVEAAPVKARTVALS